MTTHVCLILAVAVVVHSAAQAAAAMRRLVDVFRSAGQGDARIAVDPVSGCVSYEIGRQCIYFIC